MERLKEFVRSTNLLIAFIILKVITYYCLIDVNIFTNPLVLGSILVYWVLFTHISESKWKYKKWIFFVLYSFFSIIMFADTMYYNYYNQTTSIQQIYQVSNVAKVPNSFVATLIPASFLIIWDIPISLYYFKKRVQELGEGLLQPRSKKWKRMVEGTMVVVILLVAINPAQQLWLTRVNTVEFYSEHIKDIISVAKKAVFEDLWDRKEVLEAVEDATESTPAVTGLSKEVKDLQGIAKGKNILVIQLEAYQNFVINKEYNGQELTPNLNKLIGEDTLYFDNYYSVIGKGNTADAEFATMNSIYPVIDGESYRLYTSNTYNGLPWKCKDAGYETYAFHGNDPAFWNRQAAYPYQGIDHFYSIEEMDDTDIVGLGVSDRSMFSQMVDTLSHIDGKFFAFGISLTSHHPYDIGEKLQKLDILPEDQGTKFSNYLQAVHYTDSAIGELIQELKDAGLYENTVLAFYGDHHGLNCTMDDNDIYVSNFIGREYGYEEMMKVPCMIHIPGMDTQKTIHTLGCQVDFYPTMAYLLDMQIEQPYVMGQNLLVAEHGFAAFTAYLFEGSFAYDDILFQISREGEFEGSRAWNRTTGEEVDISGYEEQYERAIELKEASRQVLEQDLIGDYVSHHVVVEEENSDSQNDEEKKEEAQNESK